MAHLTAYVHTQENKYYVMIRNKNTSRALNVVRSIGSADYQVKSLNALSADKLLDAYKVAMKRDYLVIRHQYSFKDGRNIYVRKLEVGELPLGWKRGYAICVRIPREVIVSKEKLKKTCEQVVKTWRLEYTTEEIIEKTKELVAERLTQKA